MSVFPVIFCGLLGLVSCFFVLRPVITWSRRRLDIQCARELHHTHKTPMPRLGGVGLAAAFLVVQGAVWAWFSPYTAAFQTPVVIALGAMGMFLVGLADDLKPVGAKKKLFLQIAVAVAVWYLGAKIDQLKNPLSNTVYHLGVWSLPVTVLWIVGLTNLINLIDGADGLAGGISLMLMLLFAVVGGVDSRVSLLAAGMVGALLGFLYFNFPPAKIYMGDGGAYFMGSLIALMSIGTSHKGSVVVALIAPLFVLALPIIDTCLAILRRGLRGLPLFRADRQHIHHRLAKIGFSRRKIVLAFYGVTLLFLAMGFVVFWGDGRLLGIMAGLLMLVLLACAQRLSFARRWFEVGRVVGNSLQMREQIRYALDLNRCLEHEANRVEKIEELWPSFVFAAQKVGFARVKLKLADGIKVWTHEKFAPTADMPTQTACHELQHGNAGILELTAFACQPGRTASSPLRCSRCPCLADPDLFEILSELTAEGWLKSTRRWHGNNGHVLRFASQATERVEGPKGVLPAWLLRFLLRGGAYSRIASSAKTDLPRKIDL